MPSRDAAYEREESCGDTQPHEAHLHSYGEYIYFCPDDEGPPVGLSKIGADQESRPEGLGAASESSPAPATSAASTRRKPRYWSCPCGTRNERRKQRCTNPDCRRKRPKRRVPAHARTLRDDPYEVYREVNERLHGHAFGGEWTPDCCGVCGKPPSTSRHMDRDHDHVTGLPRGLACPGNAGCNALMPRQLTLERARLIVAYLERSA